MPYQGLTSDVLQSYTQVNKWCTTELYRGWQVMYYRAVHKLTSDVPQNYTQVDKWCTTVRQVIYQRTIHSDIQVMYTTWHVMYRTIHRLTSDVLQSYTQVDKWCTAELYKVDKWCTSELYTGWQVIYQRTIQSLTSDVPQCYMYNRSIHRLTSDVLQSYTRWQMMYLRTIHGLTSDVPKCYTQVDEGCIKVIYTSWQVMTRVL